MVVFIANNEGEVGKGLCALKSYAKAGPKRKTENKHDGHEARTAIRVSSSAVGSRTFTRSLSAMGTYSPTRPSWRISMRYARMKQYGDLRLIIALYFCLEYKPAHTWRKRRERTRRLTTRSWGEPKQRRNRLSMMVSTLVTILDQQQRLISITSSELVILSSTPS